MIIRSIDGWSVMRSLISISGLVFWRRGMGIVSLAVLEEVKRFNTEVTEERRRTQRKTGSPQRRSTHRKAGAILHPLSRVQDDDACRLVRDAEGAEKSNGGCVTWLRSRQAGAQPFEPALPVLRMNRPIGRFTSSAPTLAEAWK